MRLGVVARADDTGLGNQTREFVRHMNPDKVMVVDISSLNGNPQHPEWYKDESALFVRGFPKLGDIRWLLEDIDVVYVAESPYNYELYNEARKAGVKTAVQYNYEFFDWFVYGHYPRPDMLIAPTKWHYDIIDAFAESEGIRHLHLHFPVNRDHIKYTPRDNKHARSFLHIAGKPAVHDRNGTNSFIDAAKDLYARGTPAKFTIATQDQDLINRILVEAGFIRIRQHVENYADLYDEDVLVMPRRYGGNCLPVNEALSAGMPVIMPDISPNNDWLPKHWLVKAERMGEFRPRQVVQIYNTDLYDLVDKIEWLTHKASMQEERQLADKLAQSISWETLKPMYQTALEYLCSSR